ncbi:MAG: hypothetical protein H6Q90_5088 [Deltaproteobacteria bacterium]|nr:hypothetical protein [Deltaproteobacteria bacterium]
MKPVTLILVSAAITAAAASCSPFNPELDDAPYLCSVAEPACPEGYVCQMTGQTPPRDMVCLKPGGVLPDAGSNSGFQCNDDSSLGMNDTIAGAFQTPVAGQMQMVALAGLAICPEGDKDNYAINTTMLNQGIEVITSWESGMPVNVAILNASGTPIAAGMPMGDKAMRSCAPNLPIGTYFANASAQGSIKNNYRLSIKIVPNC